MAQQFFYHITITVLFLVTHVSEVSNEMVDNGTFFTMNMGKLSANGWETIIEVLKDRPRRRIEPLSRSEDNIIPADTAVTEQVLRLSFRMDLRSFSHEIIPIYR